MARYFDITAVLRLRACGPSQQVPRWPLGTSQTCEMLYEIARLIPNNIVISVNCVGYILCRMYITETNKGNRLIS